MLVIRRQAGEALLINDNIEIMVLDVSASRVTLGITAPAEVLILRREVQRAAQQNLAAARPLDWKSIRTAVEELRNGIRRPGPGSS